MTYLLTALLFILTLASPASPQVQGDSCTTCHSALGGKLAEPIELLKKTVHGTAGVSCSDCHGGDSTATDMDASMDPRKGFVRKPRPREVPELCARCHADVRRMRPYNIRTDQLTEYRESQHGRLLFGKGDERVATCTSCHGIHEIRKKDDPLSSVYYSKVPETCGRCHSDAEKMKGYKIPTNQLEEYKKSYHGQILYGKISGKNPALAPNCATCHGIHGATPPGVREVALVCSNCHSTTASYFGKSPHALAVQRVGMPRCIDCHGNHNIQFPEVGMFNICSNCHEANSPQVTLGQEIFKLMTSAQKDLERGETDLKMVEAAGLNVDVLMETLANARSKFIEAGPVSHSLDVEQVAKLVEEARAGVERLMAQAEKVRQDVKQRRQALVVLLILIALIVGLIYVKREGLKRDWLKKR